MVGEETLYRLFKFSHVNPMEMPTGLNLVYASYCGHK